MTDRILELRDGLNFKGAPVGAGTREDSHELPNPVAFDGEGFCGFAVKGSTLYRLRIEDNNGKPFGSSVLYSPERSSLSQAVVYVSDLHTPSEITDTITVARFENPNHRLRYDAAIVVTDSYLYLAGWDNYSSIYDSLLWQVRLSDHRVRKLNISANEFGGLVRDTDQDKLFVLLRPQEQSSGVGRQLAKGFLAYSYIDTYGIYEVDEETLIASPQLTAGGATIEIWHRAGTTLGSFAGSQRETPVVMSGYVVGGYMWSAMRLESEGAGAGITKFDWFGLAAWRWYELDQMKQDFSTEPHIIDMVTDSLGDYPEIDVGADVGFPYSDGWDRIANYGSYDRVWAVCYDAGLLWTSYLADSAGSFTSDTIHTHLIRYDISEWADNRDFTDEVGAPDDIVIDDGPTGIVLELVKPRTLPLTHNFVGHIPVSAEPGGYVEVIDAGERYPHGTGMYFFIGGQTQTTSNPLLYAQFGGYYLNPGTDYLTVRYTLPDGRYTDIPVQVNVLNPPADPAANLPAKEPVFAETPYEFELGVREPVGRTTPILRTLPDGRRVGYVRASPVRRYQFSDTATGHLWELNTANGNLSWRGVRPLVPNESFSFDVKALNWATDRVQSETEALVQVRVVGRNYDWPVINPIWLPTGWTRQGNGNIAANAAHTVGEYVAIDISSLAGLGTAARDGWRYKVISDQPAVARAVYTETSVDGADHIVFVGLGSGTANFDIRLTDGVSAEFSLATLSLRWAYPDGREASDVSWYGGAPIGPLSSLTITNILRYTDSAQITLANPVYVGMGDILRRNYTLQTKHGSDIITVVPTNRNLSTTINGETVMLKEVELWGNGRTLDTVGDYNATITCATTGGLINGTNYLPGAADLPITISANTASGGARPVVRYVAPTRNLAWSPARAVTTQGFDSPFSQATDYSWTVQRATGTLGFFELDLDPDNPADSPIKPGTAPITWSVASSDDTVGQAAIIDGKLELIGVTTNSAGEGCTYTLTATDGTHTITAAEIEVNYTPPTPETTQIQLLYTYDNITNWQTLDTTPDGTKLGGVEVHENGWWRERIDRPPEPLAGLRYAIAWTNADERPHFTARTNAHIQFVVGTDEASASKLIDGEVVSVPVGPITIHDQNSVEWQAYPIRFFYNAGTVAHDFDDPDDHGFTWIYPTLTWSVDEYLGANDQPYTNAQEVIHTSIKILPPAVRTQIKCFNGEGRELNPDNIVLEGISRSENLHAFTPAGLSATLNQFFFWATGMEHRIDDSYTPGTRRVFTAPTISVTLELVSPANATGLPPNLGDVFESGTDATGWNNTSLYGSYSTFPAPDGTVNDHNRWVSYDGAYSYHQVGSITIYSYGDHDLFAVVDGDDSWTGDVEWKLTIQTPAGTLDGQYYSAGYQEFRLTSTVSD